MKDFVLGVLGGFATVIALVAMPFGFVFAAFRHGFRIGVDFLE